MIAAQRAVPGIVLQTSPAVWPTLPLCPALGLLLGLLPAWSPRYPRSGPSSAAAPARALAQHFPSHVMIRFEDVGVRFDDRASRCFAA
jgi:hypothetical protein